MTAVARAAVPEAPHTLATWTAAWLPDSHLTPGAQRYTRERLRLRVFPVLGRTLLTEIRPTHLNRLYRNLRKVTGGELSHATVVRLHGVLSQVLRAAAAEGLIEANPTADGRLPRRTAREIEAWSDPGDRLPVAAGGPGQPAALQLERRADGPHQTPQLWLDSRGRALSPTAVSKAFQRLADAFVASPAGLSVRATRLTLHGARHSYVTNLITDGLDMATVSKLAGHSSVAFTVKQYYKLLDEHAGNAAVGIAPVGPSTPARSPCDHNSTDQGLLSQVEMPCPAWQPDARRGDRTGGPPRA